MVKKRSLKEPVEPIEIIAEPVKLKRVGNIDDTGIDNKYRMPKELKEKISGVKYYEPDLKKNLVTGW